MKKRGSLLESSSSIDQPRFRVGRLGRPHGLDGYLGLYVEPEDLGAFEPGSTVYIDHDQFVVRHIRRADKGYQVVFEGVDSRDRAEAIRGRDVLVDRRRSLSDREYWPEDLRGLSVRPGGGVVVDVIVGAAQDRLIVERSGSTFEVPFVEALVPVVDIEAGYVEIVEIEGLT